ASGGPGLVMRLLRCEDRSDRGRGVRALAAVTAARLRQYPGVGAAVHGVGGIRSADRLRIRAAARPLARRTDAAVHRFPRRLPFELNYWPAGAFSPACLSQRPCTAVTPSFSTHSTSNTFGIPRA